MHAPLPADVAQRPADLLIERYRAVRAASEQICRPLAIEDYGLQCMTEASPAKWHLAHTSWYFETFVLLRFAPAYRAARPEYAYLFNSYYNAVGAQFPRDQRAWLSRPTVDEVYAYRAEIDRAIEGLLTTPAAGVPELRFILELGLQHEQQHQELMLTDLKYNLSVNPLRPAYRDDLRTPPPAASAALRWTEYAGGSQQIGYAGDGFAFDNETPRHRQLLAPYRLASRLVSNEEYQAFIAEDGYQRPELWLSDGWMERRRAGWEAPLYWWREQGQWWHYTLGGPAPVDPARPVVHVSYYEADAYARWRQARLPLEAEWEAAASGLAVRGNFAGDDYLQPLAVADGKAQFFGDAWEWTTSPYQPYSGYRAFEGALGEYNGKFMCNQFVLRGGSCASPDGHLRASYRNFFYPRDRWQFAGIRLAAD